MRQRPTGHGSVLLTAWAPEDFEEMSARHGGVIVTRGSLLGSAIHGEVAGALPGPAELQAFSMVADAEHSDLWIDALELLGARLDRASRGKDKVYDVVLRIYVDGGERWFRDNDEFEGPGFVDGPAGRELHVYLDGTVAPTVGVLRDVVERAVVAALAREPILEPRDTTIARLHRYVDGAFGGLEL